MVTRGDQGGEPLPRSLPPPRPPEPCPAAAGPGCLEQPGSLASLGLRSLSLGARPFSSTLGRRQLGLGVGQLGVQLFDPVAQSVGACSLGDPALLRPFLVLLGPLGACIGRLRTLQCRVGVGELGLHHVEAVS